jgi:hypothetical protein
VHAGQQRAAERLISTVYREDRTFHRSAVGGGGGRWRMSWEGERYIR